VPYFGSYQQVKKYSLLHSVQTDPGVNLISYPKDTWGFFLRKKQPEREADHSSSSTSEVIPSYVFMASALIS
jgi:hypothetical protein